MANKPRKKSTPTRKKATPPVPRFEIIHEEASTSLDQSWVKLRRRLAPFVEVGRAALGDAYSVLAQVALEKKEDWEDQQAEKKALNRQAVRQGQRIASPLLLKAGSSRGKNKVKKSKKS